jgi:hypothetical protein
MNTNKHLSGILKVTELSDNLLKKITTTRLLKLFHKTRKMLFASIYCNYKDKYFITNQYNRYKEELNSREHIPKK